MRERRPISPDRLDPQQSRHLLAAWLVTVFAISACYDPGILLASGAAAAFLFRRELRRSLGRVLRSAVPVTAGLSLGSMFWVRAITGGWPAAEPFVALALRTVLIAFVTFAVLERVDLLRVLAPYPALSRLIVVTLAQVHALRMIATESRDGLQSRLPRRPGALDVMRGAGGITGALVTLSMRNARDISDAMRSRGF